MSQNMQNLIFTSFFLFHKLNFEVVDKFVLSIYTGKVSKCNIMYLFRTIWVIPSNVLITQHLGCLPTEMGRQSKCCVHNAFLIFCWNCSEQFKPVSEIFKLMKSAWWYGECFPDTISPLLFEYMKIWIGTKPCPLLLCIATFTLWRKICV